MYEFWYCPNIGYTIIYVCQWSFLKSVKMSKFSLNHYQIVSNQSYTWMANSWFSAAILCFINAVIGKIDIALGKRKNLQARSASQCVFGYCGKIEKKTRKIKKMRDIFHLNIKYKG